jgi:Magnesium chelatase, subunit ChlI
MWARRLTTILPAMTLAEALETTRIHRFAGLTSDRTAPVITRPCRAPHHTIPDVGLIRVLSPQLPAPFTDRFVRHYDSTSEPERFDIALAEAETDVQPGIMADDLRGEAAVFRVAGWSSGDHTTTMPHRPGAV